MQNQHSLRRFVQKCLKVFMKLLSVKKTQKACKYRFVIWPLFIHEQTRKYTTNRNACRPKYRLEIVKGISI